MKGRLKDRPLDALLQSLRARNASGVLTLEKKPVKRQICLLKGIVHLAVSNRREERLGEFMLRCQILPEETLRAAEKESTLDGRKFGEVLIASGAISAENLRAQVRLHILDIILNSYEWEDAEYRFAEGLPNIVGEVTAELTPLEISLERYRRQTPSGRMTRMQENPDMVLILSAPAEGDLRRAKLNATESFILSRAAGANDLQGIIRDTPFAETDTMRAIATLAAAGVVTLAPRPAVPTGGRAGARIAQKTGRSSAGSTPPDPAPVPAEIAYYERMHTLLIGADYYRTLDIEHGASPEEARNAYYRLAKEIHPDRFLSPPLDVLHPKMEELFAHVLEAYKTLVDPAARDRYEAERLTTGQAPKPTHSEQREVARQNFLRGRALLEMGKMIEAVRFLQNAVELEPNRPDYRRVLAGAQVGNPRLRRDAEANFLRAIELEPALADNYLQLALLYLRLGERDRAEENLRECLKWEPGNAEAKRVLGEIRGTGGSAPSASTFKPGSPS